MMKRSHWALFLLAPVGGNLEDHIRQYENMVYDSKIEDRWSQSRRYQNDIADRSNNEFEPKAHVNSDEVIKVEWYLRRGPLGAPVVLGDLKKVSNSKILDGALWGILKESTQSDFFSKNNDWYLLRSIVGTFIKRHPLKSVLLTEEHSPWWAWMIGQRVKKDAPAELRALSSVYLSRTELHPVKRLQGYAFAHGLLASSEDFHSANLVAEEVVDQATNSMPVIRRSMRDFFELTKGKDKRLILDAENLFSNIAEVLNQRSDFALSAEVMAYRSLLKLARGSSINAREFLDIANSEYEGARWGKAYQYYSLALSAGGLSDVESNDLLEARMRQLIAGSKSNSVDDISIDDFEKMLESTFNSVFRDEALAGLAGFLENIEFLYEAEQAWDWVRRYSYRKDRRLVGVKRLIEFKTETVKKITRGPKSRARLITAIEESMTLAVSRQHSKLLRVLLTNLRLKAARLNSNSDRLVKAGLKDFEQRIAGLK